MVQLHQPASQWVEGKGRQPDVEAAGGEAIQHAQTHATGEASTVVTGAEIKKGKSERRAWALVTAAMFAKNLDTWFLGLSNYGGVIQHTGMGLGESMSSAFFESHPAV